MMTTITAKRRIGVRLAVLASAAPLALCAAAQTEPARIAVGVLAHDYGPVSDRHEVGADLNLEAQWPLRPVGWTWSWMPQLRLGITASLAGETSLLYGDVCLERSLAARWFGAVWIGLALHDGPLHQTDGERCTVYSDCGFGSRVLPHVGVELGYRLANGHAVSLYYGHVSHLGLLSEENEGIDQLGLRYRFDF